MGGFIPDARTKQQVPICNAIEAGDFKQALKLVDKRLAKSSDTYLVALRCYIQSKHDQPSERTQAYLRIMAIGQPNCKEIISDVDEMSLYDEAAGSISPKSDDKIGAALCQMRLNSAKANPKDERLLRDCFNDCVQLFQWEYAQQIVNILEKTFTGNREYVFWKLATIYTFVKTPQCDSFKRGILVAVASQTMKALANATIKAAGASALPARSLQTPQELLLYHRILECNNQNLDRLKAYKDPYIGVVSKIAKGEWVFKRDQVLLLQEERVWDELLEVCEHLLEGAQSTTSGKIIDSRGGDWKVWEAFIKAAVELQTKESHDKVRGQIKAHLDPAAGLNKTYKRNAMLANVKFAFELQKDGKGRSMLVRSNTPLDNIQPKNAALISYLSEYGHMPAVFGDVKGYLEKCSYSEIIEVFKPIILPIMFYRWPWAWLDECKEGRKSYIADRPKISDISRVTSQIAYNKINNFYRVCNQPPETNMEAPRPLDSIPLAIEYYEHYKPVDSTTTDEGDVDSVDSNDAYITCNWCGQKRHVWCEGCHVNTAMGLIRDYSQAIKGHAIGGPYKNGVNMSMQIKLPLLPTDIHPADDLAIMAAVTLIRLTASPANRFYATHDNFEMRHGHQRLMQAAALLEYAHSKSAANTQILLLLVRLYAMLGAGSLALRAYNKLNLKQIQGDTLGYIMFDRVSSLHPHPVKDAVSGSAEILNPIDNIAKIQRMYGNTHSQIKKNCLRSLEAGNHDSFCQLVDGTEKFTNSVGIPMTIIEHRKILRLTKPNTVMNLESQGYDLLSTYPIKHRFTDNLDYKCFPDFEASENPSIERWLRLGPPASDERARGFLLLEQLWMILRSPDDNSSKIISNLRDLELSLKWAQNLEVADKMTGQEACLYGIGFDLTQLILAACLKDQSLNAIPEATLRQCILHIALFLENFKTIQSIDLGAIRYHPNFKDTLHPMYVRHEAASLVIAASKFLHSKSVTADPIYRTELDMLATSARNIQQMIVDMAGKIKAKMNNGGWFDRIITWLWEEPIGVSNLEITDFIDPRYVGTPGRWVAQEIGTTFTDWWVGEMVDSWQESVLGLAALTVDGAKK